MPPPSLLLVPWACLFLKAEVVDVVPLDLERPVWLPRGRGPVPWEWGSWSPPASGRRWKVHQLVVEVVGTLGKKAMGQVEHGRGLLARRILRIDTVERERKRKRKEVSKKDPLSPRHASLSFGLCQNSPCVVVKVVEKRRGWKVEHTHALFRLLLHMFTSECTHLIRPADADGALVVLVEGSDHFVAGSAAFFLYFSLFFSDCMYLPHKRVVCAPFLDVAWFHPRLST